jgi:hypothetical protein
VYKRQVSINLFLTKRQAGLRSLVKTTALPSTLPSKEFWSRLRALAELR